MRYSEETCPTATMSQGDEAVIEKYKKIRETVTYEMLWNMDGEAKKAFWAQFTKEEMAVLYKHCYIA